MKRLKYIVMLSLISFFLVSCNKNTETEINYRFADREEGISLILDNTSYYNGFSQNDLDYRVQKKGATLDEWLSFAEEQVLDFSEEEKQCIDESIDRIESVLDENGYVLPELDEIIFVKTTMIEEFGAGAYTHKNQIYMGEGEMVYMLSDNEKEQRYIDYVMCHEIFHCLTRNNPQFREDMYRIINFTVQEEDFEIVPEIHDVFISNPDVNRHNSYAAFTINGEKMDCFTLWITTKPFENPGDSFFEYTTTGLVPINDLDTLYTMDDAEDFWEVFGHNTDYVTDPEECLADNFGYALMYGENNMNGQAFNNPEIIKEIQEYLKK